MLNGLWAAVFGVWMSILLAIVGLLWYISYNLTPAVFLSFLAGGLCVIFFWTIFKGADILYDSRRDKAERDRGMTNMEENARLMQQQASAMAALGLAQTRQNRALLMTPDTPEPEPEYVDIDPALYAQ